MSASGQILPVTVKRENLDEQIARSIEEMIFQKHLQPGMKLPPERELASHFGVSRPTISIALQLLRQRGLAERKVGSGTTIKKIPRSVVSDCMKRYLRMKSISILELMRFRLLIEPVAAETAAQRADESDLARLREQVERLSAAFSAQDAPKYAEADIAFHQEVAVASHTEPFAIVLFAFQEIIISTILRASKIQWSLDGMQFHSKIYEAIRMHDSKKARQIMAAHLDIERYMKREIPSLLVEEHQIDPG